MNRPRLLKSIRFARAMALVSASAPIVVISMSAGLAASVAGCEESLNGSYLGPNERPLGTEVSPEDGSAHTLADASVDGKAEASAPDDAAPDADAADADDDGGGGPARGTPEMPA